MESKIFFGGLYKILCSFLHCVLQSCEEAFFVSHQYENRVTFLLTSLPNLTLNGGQNSGILEKYCSLISVWSRVVICDSSTSSGWL